MMKNENNEQPETTDNDNGIINENDDGIVPEISKAAKKISKRRRKLRKLKIKHQIPKWKARRAKSTVERLMEFKDKGGKADINDSEGQVARFEKRFKGLKIGK